MKEMEVAGGLLFLIVACMVAHYAAAFMAWANTVHRPPCIHCDEPGELRFDGVVRCEECLVVRQVAIELGPVDVVAHRIADRIIDEAVEESDLEEELRRTRG